MCVAFVTPYFSGRVVVAARPTGAAGPALKLVCMVARSGWRVLKKTSIGADERLQSQRMWRWSICFPLHVQKDKHTKPRL